MADLKKFAGQTAVYGISTIASRILNFFLTPIYTKVYAPHLYGVFTKLYAWASIFNAVMAFGMETTFFRYLNKKEGQKEKIYSNTFFVVAFISVLFVLTAFIFLKPVAAWMQQGMETSLEDYTTYILYFIVILAVDALCVIPFARIRAEGRPGRYAMIKFVNILSFIGLNLFFIFAIPYIINNNLPLAEFFKSWFKPGWVGYVFMSNLISSLLTLILLIPELLKLKFEIDAKLLKEMFAYSWPILVANLSFIINETSDKIFLGQLLPANISEYEVGVYGACSKLAIFLNIFVQAFRLGAEPFFFSTAKDKNAGATYSVIMSYFIICMALIFTGLVANIEILKYFINNPAYWEGLRAVPVLLFGYLCLGIYMNLSIWYKLSDQTKYGLYISGIGAIITIVLNIIFIPLWGFMASAWISLTVYFSMMVLSFLWGQKNYPIPYQVKKDLKYIFLSIFLVVLSFIVFKRDIIIGNLLFLLFLIFTFFSEKENLKSMFKKL